MSEWGRVLSVHRIRTPYRLIVSALALVALGLSLVLETRLLGRALLAEQLWAIGDVSLGDVLKPSLAAFVLVGVAGWLAWLLVSLLRQHSEVTLFEHGLRLERQGLTRAVGWDQLSGVGLEAHTLHPRTTAYQGVRSLRLSVGGVVVRCDARMTDYPELVKHVLERSVQYRLPQMRSAMLHGQAQTFGTWAVSMGGFTPDGMRWHALRELRSVGIEHGALCVRSVRDGKPLGQTSLEHIPDAHLLISALEDRLPLQRRSAEHRWVPGQEAGSGTSLPALKTPVLIPRPRQRA